MHINRKGNRKLLARFTQMCLSSTSSQKDMGKRYTTLLGKHLLLLCPGYWTLLISAMIFKMRKAHDNDIQDVTFILTMQA